VSFDNRYGWLDRLLHRFVFATGPVWCSLGDLEQRWFRGELDGRELQPPVLVTGLPRAGTTVLFELLAGTATFAAHTYRDMPFVLCPLLWQRFARRFRRRDEPRERLHGDGIAVALDSPAALEEVVWKRFWPQRYRGRTIAVWESCANAEFAAFFERHRRAIVAVRARAQPTARRYLAKDNLHIARIPALWEAVPEAMLVVLFRDPLQQAASLLRQHRRFTEVHARDRFGRRYMADLGHYEFGANLKPIDFDGWLAKTGERDADRLAYWLDYWRAAYRHILAHAGEERLCLVRFEQLVDGGALGALAARLGVEGDDLRGRGSALRTPAAHAVERGELAAAALDDARAIYAQLAERAVS
jgi:hypothetical protein